MHDAGDVRPTPNHRISASNGVKYCYRETGDGLVPLVLLEHFRGTWITGTLL